MEHNRTDTGSPAVEWQKIGHPYYRKTKYTCNLIREWVSTAKFQCAPVAILHTWHSLSHILHKSVCSRTVWEVMGQRWRWRMHRRCKPACQSNCFPRTRHTAFLQDHTWTKNNEKWEIQFWKMRFFSKILVQTMIYEDSLYPVISYWHCSKHRSSTPWCQTRYRHENWQLFPFRGDAQKALNTENRWVEKKQKDTSCAHKFMHPHFYIM